MFLLLYIIEPKPGIKCLKTWIWEGSNSNFQQLHYFGKVAHVYSIVLKAGKQAQKEELSSGSLGNLCPTSALTGLLMLLGSVIQGHSPKQRGSPMLTLNAGPEHTTHYAEEGLG